MFYNRGKKEIGKNILKKLSVLCVTGLLLSLFTFVNADNIDNFKSGEGARNPNYQKLNLPVNWWDLNWRYYKQLDISNPVVDYQMVITIFKENGHDDLENGIIDCEGKCEVDFSDIRFIDKTHSILIPYWIEKSNIENGDHYAIVWVKTNGDNSILMYYGNSDASSLSDGASTFVFFDDFDSYQEGETDPGDWSIKTCSFETTCSVTCDKDNAYSGKCLRVHGLDATSNSPKDEYSVAKNTINLAYGNYEILVFMKPNRHRPEVYGYVRVDGSILISKNDWGDWWRGSAVFSDDVTDIELVCRFNQLWNGGVDVFFDNLFIKKYQSNDPSWSYFGPEETSP